MRNVPAIDFREPRFKQRFRQEQEVANIPRTLRNGIAARVEFADGQSLAVMGEESRIASGDQVTHNGRDGVFPMSFLGFNEDNRVALGDGLFGSAEYSQFKAFNVNFHEADIGQLKGINRSCADGELSFIPEGLGATGVSVGRFSRNDRNVNVCGSFGVGGGDFMDLNAAVESRPEIRGQFWYRLESFNSRTSPAKEIGISASVRPDVQSSGARSCYLFDEAMRKSDFRLSEVFLPAPEDVSRGHV